MESIKAQRIPYSQIRVVFDKARELEQKGRHIIHLEIGRPDFNTPEHIVEAAIKALKEGKHHYCPNAGIPELRQAIVERIDREYGLEYSAKSEVIYPPAKHTSIATLPGMRERILILDGFSKIYSMTGWRIGYVLGPENYINPMLRYHQYMITSVNTFAQWGAVEALNGDQSPSERMIEEFKKRRDYLYEAVDQLPGFSCAKPEGAFYIFPNIEETGVDGYQMSNMLLEKAGVAMVAGECFGKHGTGHIRLSYSNSLDNLKKAVANIKAMLGSQIR